MSDKNDDSFPILIFIVCVVLWIVGAYTTIVKDKFSGGEVVFNAIVFPIDIYVGYRSIFTDDYEDEPLTEDTISDIVADETAELKTQVEELETKSQEVESQTLEAPPTADEISSIVSDEVASVQSDIEDRELELNNQVINVQNFIRNKEIEYKRRDKELENREWAIDLREKELNNREVKLNERENVLVSKDENANQ